MRIFQRIILHAKHNSNIFVTYSYSTRYFYNVPFWNVQRSLFSENKALLGCFSSKKNFSKMHKISHQQMRVNILKGPLLCKNNAVLNTIIPINHYLAINDVRKYSDSVFVNSNEVWEVVQYNSGIFKLISESLPVECLMEILKTMHCQTGLPWWTTIILATISARLFISLPLTIVDYQARAKRLNLTPKMEQIMKRIKMEIRMGVMTSTLSKSEAGNVFKRASQREYMELVKRENCHPLKSTVIALLQAPVWISFSVALRNMCCMLPYRNDAAYQNYLELTTGGFGWIQDLTDVDHSFLLPILFGLSGFANLELNQMIFQQKETKFSKFYNIFIRIFLLVLVVCMTYVPSSLSLYWTTHNFYTILQSLLLLSPKFRRLGRIPKTNFDQLHPYTDLYRKLKNRVSLK